jgi:hypothetical protein
MSAREVDELVPDDCPKCHRDMKVVESGVLPPRLAKVEATVSKRFEIVDFVMVEDRMEFEVTTTDTRKSFGRLLEDLRPQKYLAALREREGELRLLVAKLPKIEKTNVMVNILLLVATLGTTSLAGYLWGGSLSYALLFSVAIMLVLGAHELGHKIAAWRHGIAATPPYFIPVPAFLGTFGAFIKIKSPIPSKQALVEIGASGPIFGFLVAIFIAAVGLMLPRPQAIIEEINFVPLSFGLLQFLILGHIPKVLSLHPLAFAGWVGMLVTMLNLMPAGQLDGGHVARGLLPREQHYRFTRMLGFTLIILGLFWFLLLIWGLFILFFLRGYHAGALDDVSKLPKRQRTLAIGTLLMFLFCLPIPLL